MGSIRYTLERAVTNVRIELSLYRLASMSDVTRILSQIESGDSSAAEKLMPLVYDELRKLAEAKLAFEKPGQTLQATALVHEAYLRLVASPKNHADKAALHWDGKGHFFAAAAESMRRILVENARRKGRTKHGGDLVREELDDLPIVASDVHEDLLALDNALDRLKMVNKQAVELVQLRYFAGLSLAEAAELLDISPRTAGRLWAYARAWLHQEITGETANPKKV
jgi:RNA polymerase sigma factor (TIGR02999 family)